MLGHYRGLDASIQVANGENEGYYTFQTPANHCVGLQILYNSPTDQSQMSITARHTNTKHDGIDIIVISSTPLLLRNSREVTVMGTGSEMVCFEEMISDIA